MNEKAIFSDEIIGQAKLKKVRERNTIDAELGEKQIRPIQSADFDKIEQLIKKLFSRQMQKTIRSQL